MESDNPANPAPIERIQGNVLARSERRLLNWICARLPGWVTPDMLTSLGMVGAFMVFGGYIGSHWRDDWLWLTIAGYAVHWLGDSTDGSLARFRKIERPRYGYFLDHSCDGLATLLVLLGIGLSPYVEMEIALIALAGYLLMSIHAFLSVRVLGELKLSFSIFGPTELRFLLIGFTVAMMLLGPDEDSVVGGLSGLDLFAGFCGIALIVVFIIQTATTARRLAREEPARNHEWRAKQRD